MTMFMMPKEMKYPERLFLVLLSIAMCSTGCVFAPGMDVKKGAWRFHGPATVEANGVVDSGLENYVEVVDITEELALSLKVSKPEPVVPLELQVSSAEASTYRVGVNDGLSIVVWGDLDQLASGGNNNSPFIVRYVRDDGTIFFPNAGTVSVVGKTREEIRVKLTQNLSKYYENPQVDVSVEEYNSQKVIVSGQFNNTGKIPLKGIPISLSEAVSFAKGANSIADLSDIQLNRNGREYRLNYPELEKYGLANEILLLDGDVVYLSANHSNRAYVVGEVGRPQSIAIREGRLTLTDALASAGGLSPVTSSGNEVYIVRGAHSESERPIVYKLDANSPTSYMVASKFELMPQDVVFVGAAELTRWNRVISQIFPFLQLYNTVDRIEARQ